MVANVGVTYVVEDVVEDPVVPVDGTADGSLNPSPFGLVEVWQRAVSVLKEGDENEPEVDDQVGNAVKLDDRQEREKEAGVDQRPRSGEKEHIADNHVPILTRRKQRRVGQEMVHSALVLPARSVVD